MEHKHLVFVLVLFVILVINILAAACISSSSPGPAAQTPVATTAPPLTAATTAPPLAASTTTLKIYDVDADYLSTSQMGVKVTVKNTGSVTAKNVVVGLLVIDGEHMDMMERPSTIVRLIESDLICLDREVVGDIGPGGYATASLRYWTDDLYDDWYLMKVAMADNAEAVVW